jgi:hypothetical protein
VVPEQIGGYPLPHGGQFGPSKPSLDPAVFDRDERMHPWVRLPILSLLGAFWDPRHQGWQTWARVYLAGSMASYWWGTPDCDVLIGVDVGGFNRYNPDHAQPDNETLARYLTDELRTGLDPLTEHFAFPPSPDYRVTMGALGATPLPIEAPPGTPPLGGDGMEVTLYVNADSFDIRKIKPYTAYDLSTDTWAVHPQRMAHWGPQALSLGFWHHMVDVANGIKAVLALPPGPERDARVKLTYDAIHSDRKAAFGTLGRGQFDPRALQWTAMVRWGLVGALEAGMGRPVAHPAPAIP